MINIGNEASEEKKPSKAVFIGAGHGIGLSLAKLMKSTFPECRCFVTYNEPQRAQELYDASEDFDVFRIDPSCEPELQDFCHKVDKASGNLHLIVNAIGWLHDGNRGPEKSLKQIDSQQLLDYFLINSMLSPLIAKVFFDSLRHKEASRFVALSAKVGSIEDNKIGGWYGYRASKAAMNMFLRTMAVEFKNRGLNTDVLAIHPGTTITNLSKPFIKNSKLILHSPTETAKNIFSVAQSLPYAPEARFVSWNGDPIPW